MAGNSQYLGKVAPRPFILVILTAFVYNLKRTPAGLFAQF
jgi:hypothetical protein